MRIEIPGSGILEFEDFVADFSGTLSEDGSILPGVRDRLNRLSERLRIHVLTSDTFGRAEKEIGGIDCVLHILKGDGHTVQKQEYVTRLGAEKVVALGNGNNDALMLRAAKLGIAICLKEGCARRAVEAAQIFVCSPIDAIDLLLLPKRLIATLRV